MKFETKYEVILKKIDSIDVSSYAKTRNFLNGSVTKLSPYISRGLISTRQVLQSLNDKDVSFSKAEKLIQELCWRDFWQQIWIYEGDKINHDYKRPQPNGQRKGSPFFLENLNTGIESIDSKIFALKEFGYMHNHVRMYLASIVCNIAKYKWENPAFWMYYHLLDGDWASNALSWQWVAGSNSGKMYFANQENINKYTNSNQTHTFLDLTYEELNNGEFTTPNSFLDSFNFDLTTDFSGVVEDHTFINSINTKLCVYNYYNLDVNWRVGKEYDRVLLLEPSVFKKYPISQKCMEFFLNLSENIEGMNIMIGEFQDLANMIPTKEIYAKDHPLNNYPGAKMDKPELIYFPTKLNKSFFPFWKSAKKEIQKKYNWY